MCGYTTDVRVRFNADLSGAGGTGPTPRRGGRRGGGDGGLRAPAYAGNDLARRARMRSLVVGSGGGGASIRVGGLYSGGSVTVRGGVPTRVSGRLGPLAGCLDWFLFGGRGGRHKLGGIERGLERQRLVGAGTD